MFNESDFNDMDGSWYSIFSLHHTDTIGRSQEFEVQDPAIQGDLPFTEDDLDRLIARTQDMYAWISPFETSSGNPIHVTSMVVAHPEGDPQNFPRPVTVYQSGSSEVWIASQRKSALRLMDRFHAAQLDSPILQGVQTSDVAYEALNSLTTDFKAE